MLNQRTTLLFSIFISTVMLAFSNKILAHTMWLESVNNQSNEFRVLFGGHAGKLESYDAEKLKTVEAKDAQGKPLKVEKTIDAEGVILHIDGIPAVISAHFDNGIFSYVGDSRRSIAKPMNEVAGASRGTRAVKYHKTIVNWSAEALKPLNQPFEVVLLDTTAPQANKPMRVKVLRDTQPVVGIKLGHGEEGAENTPETDENGIAEFIPVKGFNKLWAGKRYPVSNDPRFTQLSYEYLLGFTAQ